MQGDKIVERILLDATNASNQIIQKAQEKADLITLEANNFVLNEKKTAQEKMAQDNDFITEKYKTLLKIEQRKLLLKSKQQLIRDLKSKALSLLLSKPKKELLNFVELLLSKNALKGETVLFNLQNVTESDLEKLEVIKNLELKIIKSSKIEAGLVIECKTVDKNLTFADLIEKSFEENQQEINSLLF